MNIIGSVLLGLGIYHLLLELLKGEPNWLVGLILLVIGLILVFIPYIPNTNWRARQ